MIFGDDIHEIRNGGKNFFIYQRAGVTPADALYVYYYYTII